MIELAPARVRRAHARFRERIIPLRGQLGSAFAPLFDLLEEFVDEVTVAANGPAPSDLDPIMDVAEAAAYCGVSRSSIYDLKKNRRLPFIEIPSATAHRPVLKFRKSELDRWLDGNSFRP